MELSLFQTSKIIRKKSYLSPPWWQHDVLYAVSLLEERRDLFVGETGYATTYAGDKECQLGMASGKGEIGRAHV